MPLPAFLRALLLAALCLLPPPVLARTDGALTFGMAQFPGELHPFAISAGAKATVLGAVRRGLFAYGPDGALLCRLCTALPTLENGGLKVEADGSESVTITLRPDQLYADGTPLTSADLLRGLAEARIFAGLATTATAIDARTVRYRLPAPSSDLGRALPDPYPAALDPDPPANPVERLRQSSFSRAPTMPGLWNGPYRVAEYHAGESILLLPNPHWSGPAPAFQRVELRLIGNTSALQANLLSGDVDLISAEVGLSFDQALQFARAHTDRFEVVFAPGDGVELLAVKLDNPLLADRRTRLALLSAIDRQAIAARLFDNRQPVADSFVPPQFARVPGAVRAPHDPARARALLAEAGFTPGPDGILRAPDGTRFSIPLTTTAGNQTRELIEQVIKDQLRRVGVEVTLANVAARTLFGETLRERKFEGLVLYQFGFAPGSVPVPQFAGASIPTAANGFRGLNYPGLADPRMDAALDAATGATDPAALAAAWRDIQAIYAAELPTLPLLAVTKAFVVPRWLAGVTPPREAGMMTQWIEDWRPR